ncbi:MAG TPA: ABC transporter ATP-binding protein [Actinomycetota bacterium]
MSVLEVRDLEIDYATSVGPVPAVRGVSFDIEEGEVLGLAGESGCGKSTIGLGLLRLLPRGAQTRGRIVLGGHDILAMSPNDLGAVRWTEGSIIFQGAQHALDPVIRVGDQIVEALATHKIADGKEADSRAASLLERVGLPPRRASDFPHEFSGGQKQRVMIAMALACEPKLVIADEPTTALDVMVQAQVLALLAELQRDMGLSMLFITHDLSVLAEVSDRVAVMYAGRIVEAGPAAQVFTDPRHPYTQALAGSFPTIGDESDLQTPVGLDGDPPDPRELPTGCTFHPRCAQAQARCKETDPPPVAFAPDRVATCVLLEPETASVARTTP